MSWVVRSLAKSLLSSDDGDDDDDCRPLEQPPPASSAGTFPASTDDPADPGSPSRGVKEDFSELTKTLTRQLWGVASFLAPPPAPSSSSDPDADAVADADADADADLSPIAGIRSDFAEIGGRVKSGISKLSGHKAVSEIAKIASTLLPWPGEEDEGPIGVTEEVLAFVRSVSMHPETWLDFPLLLGEEDSDDFEMSDAQLDHALSVEHLAPELSTLRIEICPSYMSESCFWKIYFVLLHPKLNVNDAELLSTPQILEAREKLSHKLPNQKKTGTELPTLNMPNTNPDCSIAPPSDSQDAILTVPSADFEKQAGASNDSPPSDSQEVILTVPSPEFKWQYQVKETVSNDSLPSESREARLTNPLAEFETEKHPIQATEMKIVDKSVIEEELTVQPRKNLSDASKISVQEFDDDGVDEWLVEEAEEIGVSGNTAVPIENEEDVSFSDLEDEDDAK